MTGVYSVLGFVAKLGAIEADLHVLGPAIVAHACEMVSNADQPLSLIVVPTDPPSLRPETHCTTGAVGAMLQLNSLVKLDVAAAG